MADTKISALSAASAAAVANELAINEAGASKKLTLAQVQDLLGLKKLSMASDGTTNTSVTPAKQTALDLATGTGIFNFQYFIRYQTAALTTGIKFDVNHTGTVTAFLWNQRYIDVSATAATAAPDQDNVLATAAVMGGFASRAKGTAGRGTTISVDTANADMLMIIEGLAVVTVTGNLELYMGTEVAASGAIVKAGSHLILTKM